MAPVRKSQVKNLVGMLSQCLNFHTRDTVIQTLELPVPRHSGCTRVENALLVQINKEKKFALSPSLENMINMFTRVSRNGAQYPVVSVEQFPPQELISGHRLPLPAGQAGFQHSIMGQMQEDLQNQAVRQNWTPIHSNILKQQQMNKVFSP